jgi:hypothetical protein
MTIQENKQYVTDNSDLKVSINKIYFQNDEYVKCRLTLSNKRNGIVYELFKQYKLDKCRISHWVEDVKHSKK